MLIAAFAFAWMNLLAKYLDTFHPLQVVFFRAFGTFIFLYFCSASLMHNNDATLLFSPPVMIFFGFIVFFFCSTLGWLARIALVGRVHFLPWRN